MAPESIETPEASAESKAANRARRMRASEAGVVRQVRLLPGGDAIILNISNTGLLVENKGRLPVGTIVNVRLEGASVIGMEGHIVRSRVAAIHRDGSVSYETAIEFERPQSIDGHDIEEPIVKPRPEPEAPENVYVLDTANDW